jgi:hypothetical protein
MHGQGLAFPHGFGLFFAAFIGSANGVYPGLVLFFQCVADFLFIQDAIELLEKRPGIADDSEIDSPVRPISSGAMST